MEYQDYARWLDELVEQGRLPPEDREAFLEQRQLFDEAREQIESDYMGLVVGFHRHELVSASSRAELFASTIEVSDAVLYYEAVPQRSEYERFPSGTRELVR
jgi:hypothetical protein